LVASSKSSLVGSNARFIAEEDGGEELEEEEEEEEEGDISFSAIFELKKKKRI
jgi:hypothetical protein